MKLANLSLGLDPSARTILAILAEKETTWAEYDNFRRLFDITILTTGYYDGVSSWGALTMYPSLSREGAAKVLLFGSDKMSNDIVVEEWEPAVNVYPPTPDFRFKRTKKTFRHNEAHIAAQHIQEVLEGSYHELREGSTERPVARDLLDLLSED